MCIVSDAGLLKRFIGGWMSGIGTVPKNRFILWLTMHNRLNTRIRLCNIAISDTDKCTMCENQAVTSKHTFFECAYSDDLMLKVK